MNRISNLPCENPILFIWGLGTEYWSRVFFCDVATQGIFFLGFDPTLGANNSGLKPLNIEKYHIFGKPWACSSTWWSLDESYYWKILSNSSFSFSCFACFWGFQQRAPDVACTKHWIWPFELFHWIFCMFSHCLWYIYIRLCSFNCLQHRLATFNFWVLPDRILTSSWHCVFS